MNIVQLSTFDLSGGAEKVARLLFETYRRRGHRSLLAVGFKQGTDPDVVPLPPRPPSFGRRLSERLARMRGGRHIPGFARAREWVAQWPEPHRVMAELRGEEDFDFPASRRLLDILPVRPDVLHCHNLHGGYFDLRALADLARAAPLVLTMHDAWLLSGHCAHSFDCPRWTTGCGACPDLSIYPALRHDGTARNWRRKRDIYAAARPHVVTPCRWLMGKIEQSNLGPFTASRHVIPYGIELDIFRPGDQAAARRALGLPDDAAILTFAANSIRKNMWKDYRCLSGAVERIAAGAGGRRVLMLALGEDSPSQFLGESEIRFIPFLRDPAQVAAYFRAADLYLHAARADTFPNVVLEALATGLPVVATAIGGIPEQVRSLDLPCRAPGEKMYGSDEATGVLTPAGDAAAMAEASLALIRDPALLARLARNAAADARHRFDGERQADDYLRLYAEIGASQRGTAAA
jgi:glycosyltransferase involved in cell wall biosynthesis